MKITLRELLNDESIALSESSYIEFGEGINKITVSVRDGMITISGDGAISVMPRAANLVWVCPAPLLGRHRRADVPDHGPELLAALQDFVSWRDAAVRETAWEAHLATLIARAETLIARAKG